MSYLAVVKFEEHQHYKNRRPPWIKFYVKLLNPQHPLNALPVPTRYLFDRLLLLAAEYDNAIPNDSELIASLLRMDRKACREGIDQLIKGRWIKATRTPRRASKVASKMLATETDTETDTEIIKSSSNGHYKLNERALEKLLSALKDKDDGTEFVIRGIASKFKLVEADFMVARDAAMSDTAKSPTRVAVAELKKRGEAKRAG